VSDEPSPAEPADFRRLSPLTPLVRSAIFFVAAAYTGGRQVLEERQFTGAAIAAAAVLAAGAVFGFASWYRTRFRITDTELRIDTGVFNRRSRRVRLDRIVEIGVSQPFVARLLGLAELKIETATAEAEVSLAYLPLTEAHHVRRVLLEHRDVSRAEESAELGVPGVHGTAAPPVEPVPLVRVPLSWQLKGLLASGETVGLVVFGLVVLGMVSAGLSLGAFGIGLATFGGAALSLARKLVGWWDWRVAVVPTGVQVRHGMFSLTTHTFNVERLQGVRITEPLLQRPFGLARLEVSVAGGLKDGGSGEESSGIALPVAPKELVWRLASDLIGADPDLVVSRAGLFARRTDLVPLARVQSLRLVQGPVQRWLRVASVHADSPVGLVHAQGLHRDPAEARSLVEEGVERARVARMPRPALAAEG
jgi:putative membrane protein